MADSYVLTLRARNDLAEIRDYISQHDPRAALHLLESFRESFRRLGEYPRIGRERDDLASRPVRTWPVGQYLIVYEAGSPTVILRVVSGYRNLPELLGG
ncbi:type II toxin-antitoxin system RelE/ParE family toxin [Paramagnetospirillum kuznetsovii]|uniref:type II toxin-antitoxin system RelE/ParE family toxin n=1 Tax=Paramagnetospirillum kuznetsovii TaxID=2053833 RepID=UPI001374B204|nr:type II toxin-antitoxin system RelE/ParE family toxin [Paramagnetospirillum kuznetsovii]